VVHCTHACVVGSQIFAAAGQSAAVLQPTQAPVAVSQIGALRPAHCWLLVHAAWHVWVPGQQEGVVPVPQSAFVAHSTQAPCWQRGIAAGHWELLMQSTHPRVKSHS
jgi:hypothetical protein